MASSSSSSTGCSSAIWSQSPRVMAFSTVFRVLGSGMASMSMDPTSVVLINFNEYCSRFRQFLPPNKSKRSWSWLISTSRCSKKTSLACLSCSSVCSSKYNSGTKNWMGQAWHSSATQRLTRSTRPRSFQRSTRKHSRDCSKRFLALAKRALRAAKDSDTRFTRSALMRKRISEALRDHVSGSTKTSLLESFWEDGSKNLICTVSTLVLSSTFLLGLKDAYLFGDRPLDGRLTDPSIAAAGPC
mmetsp:Transcript_136041/g.322372  ORF Transcript_136041/g.322372 Transcript_136041/m.322372 type:complete len:243 (+) Transcript_136041:1892-2620(+)